jgi:thioredoxin-like negative regulator of GroEL
MESLVAWVKVTRKRKIRVVDLDADEHPEMVRRLEVHEIPALLLTIGGRVVGRLEGRSTGRQIDELIKQHVRDEPEAEPRVGGRASAGRRIRPGARPGPAGT